MERHWYYIGIALFGAEVIGRVHARNVATNPGCELRYVVDQDLARAQALCRAHGGQSASDIEAALKDKAIDAVIVASSTSVHYAHLMAVIASGKPVLCEKPVAFDYRDTRRAAELARSKHLKTKLGFTFRYAPAVRYMRQLVADGFVGAYPEHVIEQFVQVLLPSEEALTIDRLLAAGADVLVPIDAKLRVQKPKLFAITVEKPGGVVVSDQKRIALVATP